MGTTKRNAAVTDVKKIRQQLQLSQAEFAYRFGFAVATLRDWEQGRYSPDSAARALLTVVSFSPDTVCHALDATRAVG